MSRVKEISQHHIVEILVERTDASREEALRFVRVFFEEMREELVSGETASIGDLCDLVPNVSGKRCSISLLPGRDLKRAMDRSSE